MFKTVRGPQKYSLGLCLIPLVSLIWSQTESMAWKGLCFVPHITPRWGDVFGPRFRVYVFAP